MFRVEKIFYKYLVFEGNDGSGKTTIANAIYDRLPGEKVFTKEPGSPVLKFCQDVRKIIIHGKEQNLDDITYAHLFFSDAYENLRQVVEPALYSGKWVVSDRSVLSNKAYWPPEVQYVHRSNHEWFRGLFPTVFYMNVPPEECLKRITSRKKEINAFEREHVITKIGLIHDRYEVYVIPEMQQSEINHHIIDNTKSIDEVVNHVWDIIVKTFDKLLERR